MIEIITANINETQRLLREGFHVVNITVGTGLPAFAPTWDMVRSIHQTRADSEKAKHLPGAAMAIQNYKKTYAAMMERSKVEHSTEWKKLSKERKIALVCFCSGKGFCHRFPLVDILTEYLDEVQHDPVIYNGELKK